MEDRKMEWKAAYSVGLREIDDQHKELLSLFCRVTDILDESKSWTDIHYRIVELRTFAAYHFEFEEALMRMFGYTEHDRHADSHKQFFIQLAEFEKHSILGDVKQEMLQFLFDWLFSHIMKSDKAYAQYILAGASVVRSAEAESGLLATA
ncbi:bacteriohemerythrin [Rhodocyclaceae bacterium]